MLLLSSGAAAEPRFTFGAGAAFPSDYHWNTGYSFDVTGGYRSTLAGFGVTPILSLGFSRVEETPPAPWTYDLTGFSVVPGVRADIPLGRPNTCLWFEGGIGFLYAAESTDTSPFAEELRSYGNFSFEAGAGLEVGLTKMIALGPYASFESPIGKSGGNTFVAGLRLTLSLKRSVP